MVCILPVRFESVKVIIEPCFRYRSVVRAKHTHLAPAVPAHAAGFDSLVKSCLVTKADALVRKALVRSQVRTEITVLDTITGEVKASVQTRCFGY